ncbi:MAG: phosphoenolpyruvate carboxykinase [Chloroflexi bacterium HGW-Chloroflexi-5]|jgi:energy-coupling factor transporter ATP-binding protein EcfA2|nr:MAG: phosphoenolpyruvate carboxykinase [Chloroflexi bacterium HGW-Chloroflexi-5]
MKKTSFQMLDGKIVLWLRDRVCEDADQLLSSDQFRKFLHRCLSEIQNKNSKLMGVFGGSTITDKDEEKLIVTLKFLTNLPAEHVAKLVEGSDIFFKDSSLFNALVEHIYNYWRHFQRLIVCQSDLNNTDLKPNTTFNRTIEHLTTLIRNTYRDIQVNITGKYPRIYRQVSAGAEIAAITKLKNLHIPEIYKQKLQDIGLIRQVLLYPPMIFNSKTNKRTGTYEAVNTNPIEMINLDPTKWLCYPAMVGSLLILVYFSTDEFELNFALCNLFELAVGPELQRKPDAMIFFGVEKEQLPEELRLKSYFYDDQQNELLIGIVPNDDSFGYFGYVKKLVLTLHNIRMMKTGTLPFHGACFQLKLANTPPKTVLVMGDTGAGKSETLEAFRSIASNEIEDITIIADDMGSLSINQDGEVIACGTEIGAFVRLDDLQPGYAFGQMDRAVLMNANQVNARVVIPVTTYETIMIGHKVDYVLYANNYDPIPEGEIAIRRVNDVDKALDIFRSGRVMSKGTTTTTGIVQTYFANVFGPHQYQELHEVLARKHFDKFFANQVFVGEMLTQLGVEGCEHNGPLNAAKDLLMLIKGKA